MAATTEYLPLIAKLLEKTKGRKVEWKGTYESTTFICALEGKYSFEIEKGVTSNRNPYRRLTMKDNLEGEVFVAFAVVPDVDTSDQNDQLFQMLDELYQQARRVALDIDRKVDEISDILDKM